MRAFGHQEWKQGDQTRLARDKRVHKVAMVKDKTTHIDSQQEVDADCHLVPFYCCIQRQIARNSKVSLTVST